MRGSVPGLPQPLGEDDDLGSHVKLINVGCWQGRDEELGGSLQDGKEEPWGLEVLGCNRRGGSVTSPTICTYELKQCSPATPSRQPILGPLLCSSFCLSLLYAVPQMVLTQSRCSIPSVRGSKMNVMPLFPQYLFVRCLCRSVCKGTPSTGATEWPPGSTGLLTPKG